MALGLPYDSVEGRAWAGALTSLMTGHAYATSARIASRMGPFAGFAANERAHAQRVAHAPRRQLRDRRATLVPADLLAAASRRGTSRCATARSTACATARPSVLAPTGTIGLMMDCDTTGIEPDLGLVQVQEARRRRQHVRSSTRRCRGPCASLGYTAEQIDEIVAYIDREKSILGAPHLAAEHVPVFACSMGDNAIHYEGHVRMMGAVQPFLSGAISKTVNMPEEASRRRHRGAAPAVVASSA